MIDELAELNAIVDAPVVAAERGGWGFENHTAIARLADGRRLVVQRLASRALAAAGIRAPRQIAANPNTTPPYAVREYLPGELGATQMGTVEGGRMAAPAACRRDRSGRRDSRAGTGAAAAALP